MSYGIWIKPYGSAREWIGPESFLDLVLSVAEELARNVTVEQIIVLDVNSGKIQAQWQAGKEVVPDYDLWRCGRTSDVCQALRMVSRTLLKTNRTVALMGPSHDVVRQMMKDVQDCYAPGSCRFNSAKLALEFKNGGRVRLYQAGRHSSLCGPRHHFVWLHQINPKDPVVPLAWHTLPPNFRNRMVITRGPVCKQ